jgi:hypothetical protein
MNTIRAITGACEAGVKQFVQSLGNIPKELTVAGVIEITKGRYGDKEFEGFFR